MLTEAGEMYLKDRMATLGISDEAEPILSHEAYEAVCRMYWVSAWKREHEPASPNMWCFSVHQPLRVMNPDMYWRRPTYQEALTRQACYLASIGIETPWWHGVPDWWRLYVVEGAGRFSIPEAPSRAYRRR